MDNNQPTKHYDFKQDVTKFNNEKYYSTVSSILSTECSALTNVTTVTNVEQDKLGIDFIMEVKNGNTYNIELKTRTTTYNDILLEIYSAVEYDTPGWAVDPKKLTDYLIYFWEPTGNYYILPYKLLRKTTISHKDYYLKNYQTKPTVNKGYTTINAAVKFPKLLEDMTECNDNVTPRYNTNMKLW